MIRVFFNNREIKVIESNKVDNTSQSVAALCDFLEKDIKSICLKVNNLSDFFDKIKSKFTFIDAAGSIIINEENKVLLIHRRNKWDLPKGKIDNNESPLSAAIRETYEECNILLNEKNASFFDYTYHIYIQNNIRYFKRTYWFLFFLKEKILNTLIPQKDEEINMIIFATKDEWKNIYSNNSYRNIVNLLSRLEKLNKW
ncbi:MAG: NUDIX domain-containing protein [Bacteroidales bacterium]|nr:NUDIX domain-containing protein [Bacteroidales bacterium]